MKRHSEVYLPRPLLQVFDTSKNLRLLGSYGHETAMTCVLYRGQGFFLMLNIPHADLDQEVSMEFWYDDEIEDLKDGLISELQDIRMLGSEGEIVEQQLKIILRRVNQADTTALPQQLERGIELL